MSENNTHEYVEIIYNGETILVSHDVADYLEDYRRDMHRQLMKKKRNQENIRCEENFIEPLMECKPTCFVDELVHRLVMEQLPEYIALLPEIQRRRFVAYYYEGLTYQDIATCEGVDHRAVMRSVKSALDKIKKYFI